MIPLSEDIDLINFRKATDMLLVAHGIPKVLLLWRSLVLRCFEIVLIWCDTFRCF